ncbi:hypothetical protein D3C76_1423440 [compost metagenome]
MPSGSRPGSVRGREPVAMIRFVGTTVSISPSGSSTATAPLFGEKIDGPITRPFPSITRILCLRIKYSTPL